MERTEAVPYSDGWLGRSAAVPQPAKSWGFAGKKVDCGREIPPVDEEFEIGKAGVSQNGGIRWRRAAEAGVVREVVAAAQVEAAGRWIRDARRACRRS